MRRLGLEPGFILVRITVEFLGVIPRSELRVAARLIRPGRRVRLLEAEARSQGRTVALARAWEIATRPGELLEEVAPASKRSIPPPQPPPLAGWEAKMAARPLAALGSDEARKGRSRARKNSWDTHPDPSLHQANSGVSFFSGFQSRCRSIPAPPPPFSRSLRRSLSQHDSRPNADRSTARRAGQELGSPKRGRRHPRTVHQKSPSVGHECGLDLLAAKAGNTISMLGPKL
jgi:hypothetical protein